jgi:hypothetical protein
MKLKKIVTLSLIMVMVILPFQTANAATLTTNSNPNYTFQNTDGEFDTVYCNISLTQDYTVNQMLATYGLRTSFFGIQEIGCGGLDIWSISPPCYKNSSGSTSYTFNDWQYMPVWVDSNTRILNSVQSYQSLSFPIPNGLIYYSNYTLSGSEFFPAIAWPMVRYGEISVIIG